MKSDAAGKVILITGASAGFGKQTTLALIAEGHCVYGAARRLDKMQDLVDAGGHALKMDVTDDASVEIGVAKIIAEQGHIDALVNNAGYGAYDFIETASIEQMKKMYDVNVWGMVRVSQQVLPHMRKRQQGRIVNISSLTGKVSMAFLGLYASSKHAVEAISDALRQEVSRFGIDVAIIEPGAFQTDFESTMLSELKEANHGPAYQPIADRFIPHLGKIYAKSPTPEPVVEAIVSAIGSAKPKTRYVVGQDAKMVLGLNKLLGDRTVDGLILKQLKLD